MRQRLSFRALLLVAIVILGGLSSAALCNSYEAKASRIVNDGQKQVEEINAAAAPDMRACALGQFEACDRTMDSLSLMADEIETMHGKLSKLNPSSDAKQWHADYLVMLEKMLWLIRSTDAAWQSGDLAAIISAGTAFEELVREEDRLAAYFNEELR
jgi:hypothetical protein